MSQIFRLYRLPPLNLKIHCDLSDNCVCISTAHCQLSLPFFPIFNNPNRTLIKQQHLLLYYYQVEVAATTLFSDAKPNSTYFTKCHNTADIDFLWIYPWFVLFNIWGRKKLFLKQQTLQIILHDIENTIFFISSCDSCKPVLQY